MRISALCSNNSKMHSRMPRPRLRRRVAIGDGSRVHRRCPTLVTRYWSHSPSYPHLPYQTDLFAHHHVPRQRWLHRNTSALRLTKNPSRHLGTDARWVCPLAPSCRRHPPAWVLSLSKSNTPKHRMSDPYRAANEPVWIPLPSRAISLPTPSAMIAHNSILIDVTTCLTFALQQGGSMYNNSLYIWFFCSEFVRLLAKDSLLSIATWFQF